MNDNYLYLYKDIYQEHCQQIRRQIALNRLAFPAQRPGVLERVAGLLLHLGTALQQRCDRQIQQVHRKNMLELGMLEELRMCR
ncbi:MAG: hypothetical protein U0175_21515 [Caldilineaceae bacterium]